MQRSYEPDRVPVWLPEEDRQAHWRLRMPDMTALNDCTKHEGRS